MTTLALSAMSQDAVPAVEASWLAAAKGEALPGGAAIAGDEPEKRYEEGADPAKTFYVCRAAVDGAVQVGKAEAGGACQLTHWGIPRSVDRYEVLAALSSEWSSWRSDTPGGLRAERAVVGGREVDGRSLYVCRAKSICKMRNTDGTTGVCTIEGRHPGSCPVPL